MKIQHFGASTIFKDTHIYLVGGFSPPLWKMMEWKSVGMMKFPTEWKNHPAMFQTTNQLYISHLTNSWSHAATSPAPWLPAISLDSEAEEEAAPTPGHSGAVLARVVTVVTPYLGEPVEWRWFKERLHWKLWFLHVYFFLPWSFQQASRIFL